jgi:ABC-type Mn2+/Zn2+ transport system ATPase subunit
MANSIISVKNLSVAFDGRNALHQVSFEIERGDIVAIVGPNGSGKTTLFRAILGLVPYQGQVKINGSSVSKALSHIGYVPQRFVFDRTIPMTVEEFLKISFDHVSSARINHVLKEVDMVHRKEAQIGILSGGELRRILIARALINDPLLLLLDEATSGVDVAGAKTFYEIIAHLNQIHQTTVLLISHEVNMVYEFANEVICLNHDLICYGKPKEALTREVLDKLYGKEFRFQEHEH